MSTVAAVPVPTKATNSATVATMSAGDGLRTQGDFEMQTGRHGPTLRWWDREELFPMPGDRPPLEPLADDFDFLTSDLCGGRLGARLSITQAARRQIRTRASRSTA